MIESFMKKLPAAMAKSLDKMKGSMLISMAKGMAPNDAEAMARHWGFVPVNTPPKVVLVAEKEVKRDLTQTVIPDRPLTDDMKAVLRSMPLKEELPAPTEDKAKKEVEGIADTGLDKKIPAMNLIIQKESHVEDYKAIRSAGIIAKDLSEVNVTSNELIHPVFGRKIVDLGYKTVYLTSVSLLARTQVWERQRTLRPDRAARIASSKIALGRTKSLSGVITMFSDSLTGQSGIVDGQHRAGALMMLSQQGHWDGLENNILIDVFETKSDEEIVALFKEINSAEPVRLVDMPGEGASLAVKDILDSTIEDLCSKFSEMFKPSLRCKAPHLHEAIFRDDIFQSEVISRRGFKSAADLKELIAVTNEEYGKRSDDEWENILLASKMFKVRGKPMSEAIKKARLNKFFLGLDNAWMHAP